MCLRTCLSEFPLGANVLAARFYAAGKDREMSETVHTSITLALDQWNYDGSYRGASCKVGT